MHSGNRRERGGIACMDKMEADERQWRLGIEPQSAEMAKI